MLKCTVFLGSKKADGAYEVRGTAFFLGRELNQEHKFVYLVTAKHVLDGIKNKLGLDSVGVRINIKGGLSRWFDVKISEWKSHPNHSPESPVDVSVFLVTGALHDLDIECYPLNEAATKSVIDRNEIGVGDELFFTGLFHYRYGSQRNIPIVRIGNIAAMPDPNELVPTSIGKVEAYLIEARSIGGLSGSPVYVNLGTTRWVDGEVRFAPKRFNFYLLGLMHGHWDSSNAADLDEVNADDKVTKGVNVGIGIVIPTVKILEVINQPVFKKNEEDSARLLAEEHLPSTDDLLSDDGLTSETFEGALKRASRKVSSQPESEYDET